MHMCDTYNAVHAAAFMIGNINCISCLIISERYLVNLNLAILFLIIKQ